MRMPLQTTANRQERNTSIGTPRTSHVGTFALEPLFPQLLGLQTDRLQLLHPADHRCLVARAASRSLNCGITVTICSVIHSYSHQSVHLLISHMSSQTRRRSTAGGLRLVDLWSVSDSVFFIFIYALLVLSMKDTESSGSRDHAAAGSGTP